ncbi:MAG: DUF371 domain-containing protein [Candidatus Micrarchaeota archaeon]|nr:DUF371 domain-containing protein [Candidatus Micrarchaeota archaeon]
MKFVFYGRGHENIKAEHETTIEFTKEHTLTQRGDCIVAVSCEAACADLPEKLKRKLKSGCKVRIEIRACGFSETIEAYGHPDLVLEHPTDIVIRKSEFIDSRTLCIRANKSAAGLDRRLVKTLKNKNTRVEIIIETGS